uniref:Putative gamma-glutamylcyclotransferase n=1 Tax=Chloropicon roscoffensis TaxID=1461544 RepID=A0A7S3CAE0_9CHLO|mmetsp:Transcript_2559/g.7800  ORF Transcript_2559/g.7800 Transcript_2559/m.7800 type:complete len:176 (+) Transcript_2559:42-569(+)
MAENLFVYGSLQSPAVLKVLLGRNPRQRRAILNGYSRFRVPGRTYPGINEDVNGTVDGSLLSELTVSETVLLDAFEGEEYVKRKVEVFEEEYRDERVVAKKKEEHEEKLSKLAEAYVFRNVVTAREDWSLEEFERFHLEGFLKLCEEFVEEEGQKARDQLRWAKGQENSTGGDGE